MLVIVISRLLRTLKKAPETSGNLQSHFVAFRLTDNTSENAFQPIREDQMNS